MNSFKITFLVTFLTVLAVKAGSALGGPHGALSAFLMALAAHGISYWLGDRIILRLRGAKELQPDGLPRLHRALEELTRRAQMPMPKLYLLPQPTATVFAAGRDEKHAALAIGEATQMLQEAKLQNLLADELSRLKNRDRLGATITASVTGAISVLIDIGR